MITRMEFLHALIAQTQAGLPEGIEALRSGQLGIGIGIIGLAVVGVIRNLRIESIVDGVAGVVFAAIIAALAAAFQELGSGGHVATAIFAAAFALMTTLSAYFIPAQTSK